MFSALAIFVQDFKWHYTYVIKLLADTCPSVILWSVMAVYTGSSHTIRPVSTPPRSQHNSLFSLARYVNNCVVHVNKRLNNLHPQSQCKASTCLLDSNFQHNVWQLMAVRIHIVVLIVWQWVLPDCMKKKIAHLCNPRQVQPWVSSLSTSHYLFDISLCPLQQLLDEHKTLRILVLLFMMLISIPVLQVNHRMKIAQALMNLTTIQQSLLTSVIWFFCPQQMLPMNSCARWGLGL